MESNDCEGVLEVVVSRVRYQVTQAVLRQVFSPYGVIEQIKISQEFNNLRVSIQFQSGASATSAMSSLHGRNIYDGCCMLNIQSANGKKKSQIDDAKFFEANFFEEILQKLRDDMAEIDQNRIKMDKRVGLSEISPKKIELHPQVCSSFMDSGDRVLVVTIKDAIYPITEEVLHQVFDSYGLIDHLEMLQSEDEDVYALLCFRSVWSAMAAKTSLQRRHIYDGCCKLEIEYYSQPKKISMIEPNLTFISDQFLDKKYENQEIVEDLTVGVTQIGSSERRHFELDTSSVNLVRREIKYRGQTQEKSQKIEDKTIIEHDQFSNLKIVNQVVVVEDVSDEVSFNEISSDNEKNFKDYFNHDKIFDFKLSRSKELEYENNGAGYKDNKVDSNVKSINRKLKEYSVEEIGLNKVYDQALPPPKPPDSTIKHYISSTMSAEKENKNKNIQMLQNQLEYSRIIHEHDFPNNHAQIEGVWCQIERLNNDMKAFKESLLSKMGRIIIIDTCRIEENPYKQVSSRKIIDAVNAESIPSTITNVNTKIQEAFIILESQVDQNMIDLVKTKKIGEFGANAILVVSIDDWKAGAAEKEVPFYKPIAGLFGKTNMRLLVPSLTIICGEEKVLIFDPEIGTIDVLVQLVRFMDEYSNVKTSTLVTQESSIENFANGASLEICQKNIKMHKMIAQQMLLGEMEIDTLQGKLDSRSRVSSVTIEVSHHLFLLIMNNNNMFDDSPHLINCRSAVEEDSGGECYLAVQNGSHNSENGSNISLIAELVEEPLENLFVVLVEKILVVIAGKSTQLQADVHELVEYYYQNATMMKPIKEVIAAGNGDVSLRENGGGVINSDVQCVPDFQEVELASEWSKLPCFSFCSFSLEDSNHLAQLLERYKFFILTFLWWCYGFTDLPNSSSSALFDP